MNRTKNSTRNIFYGVIEKITNIILLFIVRTIFIQKLGVEYLGIHSLFVSILQVLNLAELGFSSAIVYKLYEPIAKNDKSKICALLNLYKKIYRIVGIVILVIGLAILPFLSNLINGEIPPKINIYILYIIYLAGTVITYFVFAYKTALLNAIQRKDIISKVNSILITIKSIAQICILCIYKNIYLYAIVVPIISIINNIICSVIVDKKYPEYKAEGQVDKENVAEIRKNVAGILMQRVCTTTRNSLDSTFLSKFLGLAIVGIYNNYFMVIAALTSIIGVIDDSIRASVGNSIVTESVDKNYNDMNKYNFIFMWFFGWCTITLACLFQSFMKMWMGEQYMFSNMIVVLLCIYFYSLCIGNIRYIYSTAVGLWWEERYITIAQIISNVVLNYILGKYLGVAGIVLSTIISIVFIEFVWATKVLYKNYFKNQKISTYFIWQAIYAGVTIVIAVITYFICSRVMDDGILSFIIKILICIIVPNVLYFICYHKTKYFKEAKEFLLKIMSKFCTRKGLQMDK